MIGFLLTSLLPLAPSQGTEATVLFPGHEAHLQEVAGPVDQLWVPLEQVLPATGFRLEEVGLCAGEICIPLPKDGSWTPSIEGRSWFDVTAFAQATGRGMAREGSVWSFAEAPALRGRTLLEAKAPDFELPDRDGRPRKLSSWRGKKVLLLTWASW